MKDAKDLDPNFAATRVADGLRWWRSGWGIEGQGWSDVEPFTRFPDRARELVPAPVWELSRNSAGLSLEFATDSTSIAVRWHVRSPSLAMDHMPATGKSGVDLYIRASDGWRWASIGRPLKETWNESSLIVGMSREQRECRLYLPLYNGVSEVEIGVEADAEFTGRAARPRPIVVYGTSIVQGGCAARPGMAYPSIVGRLLDRPVINLGFSGNGRMELALASLLAEIDASVYVLDCLPNMDAQMVAERVVPFVRALRAARATPIVLVENIIYQQGWIDPASGAGYRDKNAALRAAFGALRASAVGGLHYVPCEALLGDDGEGTVDGVHPTDLGFQRMALAIAPALRSALGI